MTKHQKYGLLGVLATLALCSCGGPAPSDSNTSGNSEQPSRPIESYDPNKTVEITFWHTMGKQNNDILTAMIAQFNQVYPNIKVKDLSVSGDYDELQNMLLSNVSTGNLPTMAFCYPDHVAEYIDRNAVLDMSRYVDHEQARLHGRRRVFDRRARRRPRWRQGFRRFLLERRHGIR